MIVHECSVCDNTGVVCEECGLSLKECKEVGGCDEPRQKVKCPGCDGKANHVEVEEDEPVDEGLDAEFCPVCEESPCACEDDFDEFA